MDSRWNKNVVSLLSSVTLVMRLPISWTRSTAMAFHAPDVSMATGHHHHHHHHHHYRYYYYRAFCAFFGFFWSYWRTCTPQEHRLPDDDRLTTVRNGRSTAVILICSAANFTPNEVASRTCARAHSSAAAHAFFKLRWVTVGERLLAYRESTVDLLLDVIELRVGLCSSKNCRVLISDSWCSPCRWILSRCMSVNEVEQSLFGDKFRGCLSSSCGLTDFHNAL